MNKFPVWPSLIISTIYGTTGHETLCWVWVGIALVSLILEFIQNYREE